MLLEVRHEHGDGAWIGDAAQGVDRGAHHLGVGVGLDHGDEGGHRLDGLELGEALDGVEAHCVAGVVQGHDEGLDHDLVVVLLRHLGGVLAHDGVVGGEVGRDVFGAGPAGAEEQGQPEANAQVELVPTGADSPPHAAPPWLCGSLSEALATLAPPSSR